MDKPYVKEWKRYGSSRLEAMDNSPYEVGYITPVHISEVSPAGAALFRSFHEGF